MKHERYDKVAIWLHWLVAAMVLAQFATGWIWGFFERGSEPRFYLFRTHIVIGSIILATADRARELSRDPQIRITLEGFGLARAPLAFMPEAPVPAARRALENAGLDIGQIDVVNSHNPFAVNDIVFSRETGFDVMAMNNFGSSLIWGHPHGPTGVRGIIEMIEELVVRGGGRGLFQGCAAGDTAMAVVIKVEQR